jgi:streptogramin lyase
MFVRTDMRAMMVDMTLEWDKTIPEYTHHGYQIVTDSKCNPWITDRAWSHIIKGDAATKHIKFWPTPTPSSMPRRGRMDQMDRYWFTEHTADQIGMFDTRTEQFKEFKLPYRHSVPYTVSSPDAAGWVWASSSTADRIFRLNPKTGEVLEYLVPGLPGSFDAKKISHDPTTKRPVVWMENVRAARILKVEPLE